MLKRFCLLLALFLVVSPLSIVVAQGDPFPNRFVAPDAGFTVYFPVGWTAEPSGASVTLSSGIIWLQVFRAVPGELGIAPDDGAALLAHAFNPIDETVTFDPSGVTSQSTAGQQVFLYHYDDTNENGAYSGVVAAVEAPDGSYFLGDIYPRQGTSVAPEDLELSLQIMSALEVLPGQQDAPPVVDAPGFELFQTGYGVDLPDGWSDVLDEDGFLTLESSLTVLEPRWYFPDEVAELGLEPGDVTGVLADVADRLTMDFDAANVETSFVDGQTIWHTSYNLEDSTGTYEALLAGVALDDGWTLTAWLFPTLGDTLEDTDDALSILASARRVPGEPAPADALLSESYTFEDDGVTFYYPSEWSLNDDEGFVYLGSDVSIIDPYYTLPDDLISQGTVVGDVPGGLEALFTSLYEDLTFDAFAIERRVVEGQVVLLYPFEHSGDANTHTHWLAATELDDGTQFYLDAYSVSGSELLEGELALRVAAGAVRELVPAAPGAVDPAPLDGNALINERCTVCHTRERIDQQDKEVAGWTATVDRMIGHGAVLDAAERQAVIDYLVETH